MDTTPQIVADAYLDAAEIARRLGISIKTVFRWAKEGKLPPGVKFGRLRRWRRSELVSPSASNPASAERFKLSQSCDLTYTSQQRPRSNAPCTIRARRLAMVNCAGPRGG